MFKYSFLIIALLAPSLSWAHGPKHHCDPPWKHCKKGHHHKHDCDRYYKEHYSEHYDDHHEPWYEKHHLPEIATFAVIAGATYAIINNTYYKKDGERYVYSEKPNAK
ncbi:MULTISPECIES: hypothetical protein [Photobacterium]|uniref:hypothetical protein n=1 Tax=Photobacterium TaxID=657 RepID=UPI0006B3FC3D|nr:MULTISPECIES: hypothetical protein [Photobacterium]KPA53188.1 hypothetical protein VT25_08110 [Photobacterium leiognathi subsp. mandapamensis]MBP2699877.1 hypothetical protein [Vibrio parahaemolyticus]MZG56469.1 hypothetical protein [Photobacterium lucens]MZG81135.1 hypothetical protein [Photobacterium lucens]